MAIAAIIPARRGSKGIKNKNLLQYRGENLIQHAANFATELEVDRVILSTDYDRPSVGKLPPQVEFWTRSKEGSSDTATDFDVLLDLDKAGALADLHTIVWIRPTAPKRSVVDCINALTKFSRLQRANQCNSMRSISELRANIVPIYSFLSKGSEDPIPLVENGFVDFPRRQLLPNFFYPTAQFEIIDIEESKRQAIFYPSRL